MINMSTLSSNTQFIGFSENVDLTERKTIGLNAESEPYALSEIGAEAGFQQLQDIEVITNGRLNNLEVGIPYFITAKSDQFTEQLEPGENTYMHIPLNNIYVGSDDYQECTEITFNNLISSQITVDYTEDDVPPIEIYNFNDLKYIVYELKFIELNTLREVNAPILTKHYLSTSDNSTSFIQFNNCPALESVNMPLLEEASLYFVNTYPSVSGINFPSLKNVIQLAFEQVVFESTSFTSQNIPIEKLGSFYFYDNINIESISFDTLKYCISFIENAFDLYNNANIISFSVPNVIEYVKRDGVTSFGVTYMYFSSNLNLSSITLGTIGVLKKADFINLFVEDCPLSEESVDSILALFVSLDGTNGTELSENGSIQFLTLTSPPSVQGLDDIAILQSRGWSITHN